MYFAKYSAEFAIACRGHVNRSRSVLSDQGWIGLDERNSHNTSRLCKIKRVHRSARPRAERSSIWLAKEGEGQGWERRRDDEQHNHTLRGPR